MAWLESDYLKLVTDGGELEQTTDLIVREVKRFIVDCPLGELSVADFMELDNDICRAEINKRKRNRMKMLLGGISPVLTPEASGSDEKMQNSSMKHDGPSGTDKDDDNGNTDRDESGDDSNKNIEDLIGERVDISQRSRSLEDKGAAVPELDVPIEKKDTGDRNQEIVALLKGKKRMKKKKRKVEELVLVEKVETKRKKEPAEMKVPKITVVDGCGGRSSEKKEKSKKLKKSKNKSKHKKKSARRDVIDDIFDSF
eukprot:CAMPEP_0197253050 /NCGR_PEP_ID=MMETSP1429-20130617/63491_1 /TAXON_ID=49237 /ORGANISM="Chaetoceros  sp., Strain UNC1202" /LENGTH=254 /DNA_ID=CAMNT_0042715595 /DNA_START=52 /DNA_END=816 /DNA_ORIENTATION=-